MSQTLGVTPMVTDSSELQTAGPLPLGRQRSALVQFWEGFRWAVPIPTGTLTIPFKFLFF